MTTPVTYQSLFEKYRDDSAILRMEQYARWSLPTIFADHEIRSGKQVSVQRDYQSVGALLVNQLASKMASLLFPANQSFFRLDSSVSSALMAESLGVSQDDLANSMSQLENTAYRRIFLKASYNHIVQLLKLLIVTGNALLYRDSKGTNLHTYNVRQYSVLRDGAGKVLDMVLKERIAVQDIPVGVREKFEGRDRFDQVTLWTRITREARENTDVFVMTQQVDSHDVAYREEVPAAICPYIPVTWNLLTGENLGRGLVEDYAGDFAKLSELSEALALYQIEACRVLNMVKPGSGSDIDTMAESESGAWVSGDPTTAAAYEAGDYNKIQALSADLQLVFQRLSPAFMYGGNTRDAERVTAEEIRQQAEEANQALGGVYSAIADGLHIPLAHILCWEVEPSFVVEVIKGGVTLSVLTGVAALGRSSDVSKLLQAAQALSVIMPVFTQVSKRIDTEKVLTAVLQGFGLNADEYYKSEEQLKQEQAALAQQTSPQGVGADLANVAEATTGVL